MNKAQAAPWLCQWWYTCMKQATTTRNHPILGDVPCCDEHLHDEPEGAQ